MKRLFFQLRILAGISWLLNAGLLLIVAASITLFTVILALDRETDRYLAGSFGLVPPAMYVLEQPISVQQGREIASKVEETYAGVVAKATLTFTMSTKVYWDRVVSSRFSRSGRVEHRGSVFRTISLLAMDIPRETFRLDMKRQGAPQLESVLMSEVRPDYFVSVDDLGKQSFKAELYDPATRVLLGEYTYEPDHRLFLLNLGLLAEEDEANQPETHLEFLVRRIESTLPFDESYRFQSGLYLTERESDQARSNRNISTLHYLLQGGTNPDSMVAYMTTSLSDIIFFSKQRYHNIELADDQRALNLQIIASFASHIDESANRNRIVCRLNDLEPSEQQVNGIACKNVAGQDRASLKKYVATLSGQTVTEVQRKSLFVDLQAQRRAVNRGVFFGEILLLCVILVIAVSFFQKFCDVAIKELAVVKLCGGDVLKTVVIYGCCLFCCGTVLAYLADYSLLLLINRALANYYYSRITFAYDSFFQVVGVTFLLFLSGLSLVTFNMRRYL